MELAREKYNKLLCLIGLMLLIANYAKADIQQEILADTVFEIVQPSVDVAKCRLESYSVTFDVMDRKRKVGSANRKLSSLNSQTTLSSSLSASVAFLSFSQSEQSTLSRYEDRGFESDEYLKTRKNPFKKATTTRYEISQNHSEKDVEDVLVSVFDPLSVYDHLRELVCSGLTTNTLLLVQEEREIETYQFVYKGAQRLQLPVGDIDSILMVRTRSTSTRETSIWFDINNYFIPVKIQQEKDGDTQAVLLANAFSAK
jgi:hypothetical protein